MEKRAGMRWCDRAGGVRRDRTGIGASARARARARRGFQIRARSRRGAKIGGRARAATEGGGSACERRRDRASDSKSAAAEGSRVGRGSETHRAHVHQPPEALVALGEVGIPEGGLQRVLLLRHLQPRLLVLPVAAASAAAALRLALAATSLAVHVTLGPAGGVAAEGGLTTHGGRQARLAVPGCVSPLGASRARAHTRARSRDFAGDDARPPSRPYPDVCLSNARRRVHGVGAIRSGCARRSGRLSRRVFELFPTRLLLVDRARVCAARRFVHLGFEAKKKKWNVPSAPSTPLTPWWPRYPPRARRNRTRASPSRPSTTTGARRRTPPPARPRRR